MKAPRAGEAESSVSGPLNPLIAAAGEYPFQRLERRRREIMPAGLEPIYFSAGDPRERTPDFVRQTLRDAVPEVSSYPATIGSPGLRSACAGWLERRFGARLDPETQVLSANGTKEAVFLLALAVIGHQDPEQNAVGASDQGDRPRRDTVVIPSPAYPVYGTGARMAGGRVHWVPLRAADRWRFVPEQVSEGVWRRTALLWLNSPHNPTGMVLPRETLSRAVELARRHGFWIASDEAYGDVFFDDPPASVLECGTENILALHSLSKRSAMTGYRSGFMAGDARLIAALKRFRPHVGVGTPEFVQQAAIAAWHDDAHAAVQREAYRAKRQLFIEHFGQRGWVIEASEASFYLWFRAPGGDDVAFIDRLMRVGIVAAPGSFFGPAGRGMVRWALVPTFDQCRQAIARLETMSEVEA